jgi:hypothetical protein
MRRNDVEGNGAGEGSFYVKKKALTAFFSKNGNR